MYGGGFGGGGFGGGGFGGGGFQGHQGHHGHHGHHGFGPGFNRWGGNNNYMQMNGYQNVDYTQGWNGNTHDQLLRTNIEVVFQKYDTNRTGQLEGNEFYSAYSELCLKMGLCPPQNAQDVWNAARACDANNDGRVNRNEMFELFKRIQGINGGIGVGVGGLGVNVNIGGW